MDRVARAAGVSKQTIYSHFDGKEALFEAVIAEKCRSHAIEGRGPSGTSDLTTGLLAFTRRYLDLILDPEVIAMTRQVIAQSTEPNEMARLYAQAGIARTIDELAGFLGEQSRLGRLALADPHGEAADYVHQCGARQKTELLMSLRDAVPRGERDAIARRRVREFLAGHGLPGVV